MNSETWMVELCREERLAFKKLGIRLGIARGDHHRVRRPARASDWGLTNPGPVSAGSETS